MNRLMIAIGVVLAALALATPARAFIRLCRNGFRAPTRFSRLSTVTPST